MPGFVLAVLPIAVVLAGAGWMVASRRGTHPAAFAQAAELARTSWRLDAALAASEMGVWDVDLKTDQLLWDDRARALFGVSERRDFYSEADWTGVIHPEDRDRALAAAEAAVAEDGRFVLDYRVLLNDGQVRHVRDMAAVHRGTDGSHRLVGLVWDVSADFARRQELELRRAEAEAATLAKSQFLAAMSHEIRTPMTGVLGMLDLILSEPLSPRQGERARVARASARCLLQILDDILDLSKLEAGQVRIHAEATMPRAAIGEVVELMSASAGRKGLALTLSVSPEVPDWINTDPIRLRQVVANILSNAIKFTDAGHVSVRVDYRRTEAGGTLCVAIEDTGIGIPPEVAPRLFEKFVQADTSLSRRAGGTGLGLAISRQLVELMGGRIWLDSTPGIGSTFTFTLAAPPGTAPTEHKPNARAGGNHASLRVLVAEDNATNQYLIRAFLEGAGHAVTMVENGADALAAVRETSFDVVLLDVQMPQMDGPTTARAIRALPGEAAEVPIIALTANALSGDRERYIAAGMTDYISKPIDMAEFFAVLGRACETRPLAAMPAG